VTQESVTAGSGEEQVAAEVLAANAAPAETAPEPTEEAPPSYVTKEELDSFRNQFRGDFANWTGDRAKQVDEAVNGRVAALETEVRAGAETQRNFMLSQMDEDQKAEFSKWEREQAVDNLIKAADTPPVQQPVARPSQPQISGDMQEMAAEVQTYAAARNITLTQQDAWVWQGGTSNDSAIKLLGIAQKNIDSRQAAPGNPAAPATPQTQAVAPTTASAPKIVTTDPSDMTIKESTDAMLAGDITMEQHRANIAR
jgi:hypothetical protein